MNDMPIKTLDHARQFRNGIVAIESTLLPVAWRGVTEQMEELEKPWSLKANHISTEFPVRLRRGSFIDSTTFF